MIGGTFNELAVDRTPATWDRTSFIYLSITEIYTEAKIVLRYTDLSTNEVLLQSNPYRFVAPSPLDARSMVIPLREIPFPHPGAYVFEPYLGQESLGAFRLIVHQQQ